MSDLGKTAQRNAAETVARVARKLLLELGTAQILNIRRRVARGEGLSDQKMPDVSDAYARARKGGEKTRNLLLTGRMLGGLTVEVDESKFTATIGFSDGASVEKARANQARSPWFGFSPNDRAQLNKLIQNLMRG